MKKLKKLIASVLCASMAAAALSAPAFALTFPDVEEDNTVSWARADINKMTDMGYIKGYEDGTFKPQKAVSKIETLLLMSRIMGVEEDDYAQSVEWANSANSATVSAINTTYVDELSYLMYLNALNVTDLRDYASAANANTSLLRWQAAYLMVKLAGMEEEAKTAVLDEGKFSDYASVPEAARGYVAAAVSLGLMNGMGKDDSGKDYFSPETTLTRAQMATLLSRMIDKMGRNYIIGKVVSVDSAGSEIVVSAEGSEEAVSVGSKAVVKIDGADGALDKIGSGSDIMVTYTFDDARLIETIASVADSTVYGIVNQISDGASGQQITVSDSENQKDSATYTIAPDCTYNIKGSKGSFGDVKTGNSVKLTLSGATVTAIYVTEKTTEEVGVFDGIDTDDANNTYIYVTDEVGENAERFVLSSENVKVTRNGQTATLRDLSVGDNLDMELTYGKVTGIKATSKTTTDLGTIKEIVLSDKPSIKIEVDGKENIYYMTTATKVKVNNVDGTIYDLRPGNAANFVADGSTLSSIESSATASVGKTAVSGKVSSINTTLKVISVANQNGGTDTVYYDSSTTFLKSSGKSATAKDIVAGSNVNATGSDATGYFVATILIID